MHKQNINFADDLKIANLCVIVELNLTLLVDTVFL